MTITMPALTEVEGKLNAKRQELAGIFKEAGENYDLAKVTSVPGGKDAVLDHVRKLNEELTELGKERDGLKTVQRAAEHAAEYQEGEDAGRTEKGGDEGDRSKRAKSIGEAFVESKARTQRNYEDELDVDVKATLLTSAGWAPQAIRTDRLVEFATRPIALLDRIPTVTTTQPSVVYMEETTFTNAAAETAEGAAKPQATLVFTEKTSPVRKIAVFLPVSDEQLDDVPRIRQVLDNRLPFMVRQRLAGQILVGDGTAPNLRGILNVVGIQTQAKGTDPTPDAVYKAMVLVMTTGQAMPDLAVFNPLDWQDVRLLRTADGIYIWGNPSEAGPERIWGLDVVLEQALTQNTALVGDFGDFLELDIRKGVTVEVGYNNDDFTKNLQTLRAEMRAALVVYRPAAFCTITGV